jgi:hypothetical protein
MSQINRNMLSNQDRATWAQFEKEFVVDNKNNEQRLERKCRRHSGTGSKAWMDHPVAATSSIAPLPPPPASPQGNAVSTERWSKHVKVKQKKSSVSHQTDILGPSAKSVSSLPTEILSARQSNDRIVAVTRSSEQFKTNCSTTSSSSGSEPIKMQAESSRRSLKSSEDNSKVQRKKSKSELGSRSLHERSTSYMLEDDAALPSRGRTERTHVMATEKERQRSLSKRRVTHVEQDVAAEEHNGEIVARRIQVDSVNSAQKYEDGHDKRAGQTARSSATAGTTSRGRSSSRPRTQKEVVRSMSRTRSASLTRITNIEAAAVQNDRESRSRRHPPSTY